MVTHPTRQLKTLREKIEDGERGGTETDQEHLIDFIDKLRLLGSQYSDQRREKLLRHCTIIAEEVGGLAEALEDKEAAEQIVLWINRTYDNEETNKDYRNAFRTFGARLAEDGKVPDSLAWIPTTTSRNYKPQPDPANMLDWEEDVRPMIDETMNARDAALLAVAWDSGVRSGELQELTVGNVSDHKHGLQITVDGKQPFDQGGSFLYETLFDELGSGPHPVATHTDPGSTLSVDTVESQFSTPLFPSSI